MKFLLVQKVEGVEVATRLTEDKAAFIKIEAQRRLIDALQGVKEATQRPIDTKSHSVDSGCLFKIIMYGIFGILALIGALSQGC